MIKTGNLRSELPVRTLPEEVVDLLLDQSGVERIVSTGQTTSEGQWYDQEADEWVLVVAGAVFGLREVEFGAASHLGEGEV